MLVCKTEAGDRKDPSWKAWEDRRPHHCPKPVPGFRAGSAAAGVEGAGRGGQAAPGEGPG